MPLVSFIVTTYNSENLLHNCINSIISQAYKDFEIVIVDDGSTDNTVQTIKKLQESNKQIKLIESEHVGPGNARNIGVKNAIGKYIIFADHDDYFLSHNMLEDINKYMLNGDYDIIKIQAVKKEIDGKIDDFWFNIKKPFIGNGVETIKEMINSGTIFCTVWLYFINRSYYNENKFEFHKSKLHEDFGLIPLVLLNCKKFISLPKIYYAYCQRNNSIMTTRTEAMQKRKAHDLLFFYDHLIKEIRSFKLYTNDRQLIEDYINEMTTLQFKYFYNKEYENDLKEKLQRRGLYENEGKLKEKLMKVSKTNNLS